MCPRGDFSLGQPGSRAWPPPWIFWRGWGFWFSNVCSVLAGWSDGWWCVVGFGGVAAAVHACEFLADELAALVDGLWVVGGERVWVVWVGDCPVEWFAAPCAWEVVGSVVVAEAGAFTAVGFAAFAVADALGSLAGHGHRLTVCGAGQTRGCKVWVWPASIQLFGTHVSV